MTAQKKTLNEVRLTGMAALARTLGPVDTIRFLQQFDLGSGDYTVERTQLLGNSTVEDLLRELKTKKGKPKAGR